MNSVAIAPDGTWLVTTGGNTGQIWDSGAVQGTAPRTGRSLPVETVMVAPQGTWLACVGHDGKVRIWDWDADRETACLTEPWVKVGAIAPGRYPARHHPRQHGADLGLSYGPGDQPSHRARQTGERAAISPDGTWLVTTGSDGTVQIWDSATGGEIIRLTGHTDQAAEVTIAPDGTWLATTGMDGRCGSGTGPPARRPPGSPGATRYPGR